MILYLFAGIIAGIYNLADIKRDRALDEIDYMLFLATVCLGYIAFTVMIFDIYQKWWWHR